MAYDDMLKDFKKWVTTDKNAQAMWDKVKNNSQTWSDATNYSELVGKEWAKLFERVDLSDIDEEVINEIRNGLKKAYSESAYYSQFVQNNTNGKAKIGMRSLEPRIDESRIDNLIEKLNEDSEWLLDKAVVSNIARSAVTDTIEANARIQQNAGLHAYLKRDGSNCCAWCDSMTGTYEFGSEPADFWRVHKDCTCTIEYKPSRTREVAHIRYSTSRNGVRTRQTS